MRLLKLIAYALLGYVIYELYCGMTEGRESAGQQSGTKSGDLKRALNEDAGRMNLTGGGRGTTVSTDDFQGGRSNRVVGRGVVKS